ncbi:MAG: thioredoxin-dependent thiol peroxidase [Dehalococcoidia bacterium]|nr:thioredoxin-dependent thiol peroxidase [Dehalococcoidia bacterium]
MTESTTVIKEGDRAPDFTLPSADGTPVSLADFRGKQAVVLYWYPKDDTPGCTTEACSFRDNLAVVQSKGAVVLGASPDSVKSHAKFAAKHALSFPLLSDEDATVAQAYGVWVEKSMYGKKYFGIERSTFLIDKDGVVRKVWRKVNPNKHVPEVIAALDQLT